MRAAIFNLRVRLAGIILPEPHLIILGDTEDVGLLVRALDGPGLRPDICEDPNCLCVIREDDPGASVTVDPQ